MVAVDDKIRDNQEDLRRGYFSSAYRWRRRLWAISSAVCVACAVLAFRAWGKVDAYVGENVYAGALTVISCLTVVVTYWRFRKWQVHPNPIIFWRTVCDLLIGVRFMLSPIVNSADEELFKTFDNHATRWDIDTLPQDVCRWPAFVTQLFYLASETWLAMLSLDLVLSMTNPFTDYRKNLKRYHAISWGLGLASAIFLVQFSEWTAEAPVYGIGHAGFCWIRETKGESSPLPPFPSVRLHTAHRHCSRLLSQSPRVDCRALRLPVPLTDSHTCTPAHLHTCTTLPTAPPARPPARPPQRTSTPPTRSPGCCSTRGRSPSTPLPASSSSPSSTAS
jgi:hypothetical protein